MGDVLERGQVRTVDSVKRAQEFRGGRSWCLKFIDLLAQRMSGLKHGPIQGLPFVPLSKATV